MLTEHSYGIIPLRRQGDIWQLLLIQHHTAGYWGFPKGHAEENENPKSSAIRELKEETNLDAVHFLSETILQEHYQFFVRGKCIDKTVWYFVAEVAGDIKLQQSEISNCKWVPLADADLHITHDTDKSICRKAIDLIRPLG